MQDGTGPHTLAHKLTHLIDTVRPHPDRTYTDQEIADGIGQSATQVWKLRTGRGDNPTLATLRALAAFFGVNASYFLDDEPVDEQTLAVQAAMRDAGVLAIAMRSVGLTPDSQRTVLDVLDTIRRLEGRGPAN